MQTASTALLDPTHESPQGSGRTAAGSEGRGIRSAPSKWYGHIPLKRRWRFKNHLETVASVTAACVVSVILTIGWAMTGLLVAAMLVFLTGCQPYSR